MANLKLVPDAAPTSSAAVDIYETMFGGEASVPQRDYGPPIASPFPDPRRRQLEVRDLERRFRDRLVAKSPIGERAGLVTRALVKTYRAVAMRHRSTVVDEFGRDPARATQASRWFELLYRRYFRVRVSGGQNLPQSGAAMLVSNRGGVLPLDVVMLMEAVRQHTGRSLRPLVEDTVHHVPVLGVGLARIGAVRACRENATRLLANGELVAVFPEGAHGARKPFSERYQLQRFGRGGFAKLAVETGVSIIPVAVAGAEDALPTVATSDSLGRLFGLPTLPALGLLPLPKRIRIHIGAPISVAALGAEQLPELADDVRSQVQELLDQALSARSHT